MRIVYYVFFGWGWFTVLFRELSREKQKGVWKMLSYVVALFPGHFLYLWLKKRRGNIRSLPEYRKDFLRLQQLYADVETAFAKLQKFPLPPVWISELRGKLSKIHATLALQEAEWVSLEALSGSVFAAWQVEEDLDRLFNSRRGCCSGGEGVCTSVDKLDEILDQINCALGREDESRKFLGVLPDRIVHLTTQSSKVLPQFQELLHCLYARFEIIQREVQMGTGGVYADWMFTYDSLKAISDSVERIEKGLS